MSRGLSSPPVNGTHVTRVHCACRTTPNHGALTAITTKTHHFHNFICDFLLYFG
jgi:hypothetical protein